MLHHGGGALRQGDWKYIEQLGSIGFTKPAREQPVPGGPTGQLYRLDTDRGETTNLWLEEPQRVEAMRRRLAEIVRGTND
ncbi:MAG: hypothetical protein R3B90_09725 [Planctomycetaceae bacterium]